MSSYDMATSDIRPGDSDPHALAYISHQTVPGHTQNINVLDGDRSLYSGPSRRDSQLRQMVVFIGFGATGLWFWVVKRHKWTNI